MTPVVWCAVAAVGLALARWLVGRTDAKPELGGWDVQDADYRRMLARIEESQSERRRR